MIEGLFTKAFRAGLQPVELATRILKEMEANKTVGVREVWVPNHYLFRLSPEDRERFEHTEKVLRRELEQVVRDGADERGWKLVGPAQVEFETDESLGQGELASESSLVEGATTAGQAIARDATPTRAASGAELIVFQNGASVKRFPVGSGPVVIGRLDESDIVLADAGASRRHAEVRRRDGEYVITDLDSTNGTRVNEAKVGERTLQDGDRITIGRTVIEFRRR